MFQVLKKKNLSVYFKLKPVYGYQNFDFFTEEWGVAANYLEPECSGP